MKSLALFTFLLLAPLASADAVKDREGAVRSDREKMRTGSRWIYNDIDKGFAEAAKANKPLLVVLRCVPCKACMGIDASILTSSDLQPVLDGFVCVRVINANALDLSIFQFNYDLSFSTLVFNADRTVYGRYGSWQHQRDSADATTAGYKAFLQAALGIHGNYPGNKASLAAKQGGPTPFKVPVEIPTLAGKYERELNWDGKVVQSCVHCHMIGDAYRAWYRDGGKPIPAELIYPMPAPETIGLTLDPQHCATVQSVVPGSPVAVAGLQAGDRLVSLNGSPLTSIADVAWALHRTADTAELRLAVERDGNRKEVTVALRAGWRLNTDISTRVATWQMRAMATGGLVLKSLPDEQRQSLHLADKDLGLIVDYLGANGPHGAAKKGGFQKGDILLTIESIPIRMTESQLLGSLLLNHPEKGALKTTVLRGEQRVELMLPMQ